MPNYKDLDFQGQQMGQIYVKSNENLGRFCPFFISI
jgi:hypothetical protein